mmetsp:Transcript_58214/g.161311  ORF Transcript_58214/g.161311 Transcript_58214/m.161311 type:complete len:240 (-) Transcript_58214:1164-1883(-)
MASRGAWLTATRGELRCGGACVRINHGVERCVADCDTQGRGANPELWGVLGGRRRSCVRAAAYDPLPLLLVQCPARAHLQLRYFTSVVMGRHRPASRCGRQTTGVAGGCVRDVWDGEVRCARDVLMHARRPRCSCLPRRRGTSGVLWGMPRGRTRSCVVVLLFERSRTYWSPRRWRAWPREEATARRDGGGQRRSNPIRKAASSGAARSSAMYDLAAARVSIEMRETDEDGEGVEKRGW